MVSDAAGNTYVAGVTTSSNFPVVSAIASKHALDDGFVTKLDPSGNVVFSTYIGGNGIDSIESVAVDSSGNIYLAGWTDSTDFPLVNAAQGDQPGRDAFVTKLDPSGAIIYSTYLGGNGTAEYAELVVVDSAGNAYVTGDTDGNDFPLVNPLQNDQPGVDGFVVKLNASGALVFSTYLGGNTRRWLSGKSRASSRAIGENRRGTVAKIFPEARISVRR